MTNFINEHWIIITTYLIGCVLAYGRICSIINNNIDYYKPFHIREKILLVVLSVLLSWYGFMLLWSHKQPNEKFFKWLPILLLCVVGVGCESYYVPHDKPIITIKVHGNHCDYIVDNRNDAIITAPCGWYKIGDMPIRPLDTLK